MHQVECVEEGRGDRDAAIDPVPALLEALEGEHAGGEVDPVGGERQRLGKAAAGIGERHAQRAHGAVRPLRLAQEAVPLARGQVFA